MRHARPNFPAALSGEKAPAKGQMASVVLWRLVRLLMLWRYGVRGAIKPPLNWNRANSLWYRWRYRCWLVEEKLYRRTGLPDEWWASVRGPNQQITRQ